MYYTYILKSLKNGTLYTGQTNDLRKRLIQHNTGRSNFTKKNRPYKLIYYEACINIEDSLSRELYLKTGIGKRYIKNRLKRFLSLTG